jgi:hypothetical protein
LAEQRLGGAGGAEIGDLCESLDSYLTLVGQQFDVQGLWSNSAGGCVTNGTYDLPAAHRLSAVSPALTPAILDARHSFE